ncbi:hypothetical protein L211DRAFT_843270 [Terfezia boudieri ATCC MYA-4762]|uniref:Concanavalin A-like lectin/glucanase n=1 Tax=Terfezia boudieri ATCC MYA-4762 TaxID=1051890 RepID=A0A3N4LLN1_9PEZI|nr:hypothetical protein L211DRAFT_843270 [Terfezia boudieri ATCC MYA-4762]
MQTSLCPAEVICSPTVSIYSGSNSKPVSHPLSPYNIYTPPASPRQGITLRTPPKTDLWRKPPSLNVSTAPTLYTKVPLSKFKSAKVTASSNWNTLYDQGGLALFLGPPPGEDGSTKGQWVKSGIEYVFEKPNVGTVAADIWADWSLAPVPNVGDDYAKGDEVSVTIEVEREMVDGNKEASLWVYKVNPKSGKRQGVREVTWVFKEDTGAEEGKGSTELWVGIYTARPTVPEGVGRENEELEVDFKDFEIRLFD